MNQSDRSQENAVPHIHVPENKNVLAYLKEIHPFKEIIVPFSADKVNQDITPSDFVGRFASMSSLPANSKYVIYGTEALRLLLPDDNPQEKILDLVRQPECYADTILGIRQHLAEKHSHLARLQQLMKIIEE